MGHLNKMNNIRIGNLFFELLKSSLWGTAPNLEQALSNEVWDDIFALSKEQTVTGIMLDAIAKLPEEKRPYSALRIRWIAATKYIEKQNAIMNKELTEMFTILKKKGIPTFLLKGQGVALNYPNPWHRVCGDIDIYFEGDKFQEAMNHFARLGCNIDFPPGKHHAETEYRNISWELHHISAEFFSKRNRENYRKIQSKLIAEKEKTFVTINECPIRVLPCIANALQLLAHTQRHIIVSGLGFRQICDWALFYNRYHKIIDSEESVAYMKELQLIETYYALNEISVKYLGMPDCRKFTGKNSNKMAEKIMWLITSYGNFGHYRSHSTLENKTDYVATTFWKLRNCIRFHKLAKRETSCYPVWRLHSILRNINSYIKTKCNR